MLSPPTPPTPPTPVVVVYVDDDDDVNAVRAAVFSAADAHYAEMDRIAAAAAEQVAAEKAAKTAADNQALNDSIAAALAAAVAKADAVAAALIAEEEVDACIRRERERAGRLAADAKAKLAAQNRAAAAEQRRAAAAAQAAEAQQLAREAADRDSERDRKLHQQRNVEAVLPVLPMNRRERRASLRCASSRFTELFARKKADADAAFWHGYGVYMSRFSLVPVPATDVLLFGEFDEATQQLAACAPETRCRLCCERRATHMYVPCGHVCVCRDCAAACPWVCMTCDVAPEMVLLLHGMPK